MFTTMANILLLFLTICQLHQTDSGVVIDIVTLKDKTFPPKISIVPYFPNKEPLYRGRRISGDQKINEEHTKDVVSQINDKSSKK
ncbi:hypothetical protein B5X24_HaOG208448 [Helicoverpa armigera]|uniref:Uncharacterized protein n=1 Tax=Helicoverpa armigera TaxID=29058 RepID=A0A2W1BMP8_HELAM|nr:hypothetical protein B5X24_HaOG208448 [Helicoverpa armigera]